MSNHAKKWFPLKSVLDKLRDGSKTEREKGTYFEELIIYYLRHEASYRNLGN